MRILFISCLLAALSGCTAVELANQKIDAIQDKELDALELVITKGREDVLKRELRIENQYLKDKSQIRRYKQILGMEAE